MANIGEYMGDDGAIALALQCVYDEDNTVEAFRLTETDNHIDLSIEEAAMVNALSELGITASGEDRTLQSGDELHQVKGATCFGRSDEVSKDEMLAIALQASLAEEAYVERKVAESTTAMATFKKGRAWKFVQEVVELHKCLSEEATQVSLDSFLAPVATDDIVSLTEDLIETQTEFRQANKPFEADIGYHYTKQENMRRIKADGLMSRSDRRSLGIRAAYNGSSYGDGVYTGNNPTDHFGRYGAVGLLVVRLKGNTGVFRSQASDLGIDTFLNAPGPSARIVVLRQSSQCVAVFRFDGNKLNVQDTNCSARRLLQQAHEALQRLVAELFNKEPTLDPVLGDMLEDSKPSAVELFRAQKSFPTRLLETIIYKMPEPRNGPTNSLLTAFYTIVNAKPPDECALCLTSYEQSLLSVAVRLDSCSHIFHLECLRKAASYKAQCPTCRQSFQDNTPRGTMPSGSMKVLRQSSKKCAGYEVYGTLEITYDFAAGIQTSLHPNPGQGYQATTRTAFLPDSRPGGRLLSRLQEAFRRGLCFTVGTSYIPGETNIITWASIPHKTHVSRGEHGFPDALYFANCHAALDALQVKKTAIGVTFSAS
jgi:hypothetical protein